MAGSSQQVDPDDALMEAIANRDAAAFAQWLAGSEPKIRRGLASFAHLVDTEAVVQEAMLRAWQLAPRLRSDGRGDSLLRFCHTVARRMAIDETRRRQCPVPSTDEPTQEVPVKDPFFERALRKCHEELRGQPRAALDASLRPHGPLREAEVAQAVGMKTNTFLQNLSRARKQLLECLRRSGVPSEEVLS